MKVLNRMLSLSLASTVRCFSSSPPSYSPVTLLTFDVDGTLIHGSGKSAETSVHAKSLVHAVGRVFGETDCLEKRYSSPLDLIPGNRYHGGTDGLITLNFIQAAYNLPTEISHPKLPELFEIMHEYFSSFSDDDAIAGVEPLPGVIDALKKLGSDEYKAIVKCGLVTGNVEGIARKKMRATGILGAGFLSPKAGSQRATWKGVEDNSFLGGFGSDFCSGNIADISRYYKDRGEQICIAFERAKELLKPHQKIVRIVHVGDAPSDVLAARVCYEENRFGEDVTVGCVAVATGKFTVEQLAELTGESVQGRWEPVVLKDGIADPDFIKHCGIVY